MADLVQSEIGTFPVEWPIRRFDEIFEVQQGKQVSKGNRVGSNQCAFLRTRNVFWGLLDLVDLDRMHFSEADQRRLKLSAGDLLICEGGNYGAIRVLESDKQSDLGTVVMRLLSLTSIRDFPVLEITNPNSRGVSVRLIQPKEMHVLAHFRTSERDGLPLVSTIIWLGRMFADTLLNLISTEDEFGRARMPIELLTPPPWAKLEPPTNHRKK